MNRAQLAKLFDVSERMIDKLGEQGVVVRAKNGGGYDFERSVHNYVRHLKRDDTGKQARTELVRATTQDRRLRVASRAGEVLTEREFGEVIDRVWMVMIGIDRICTRALYDGAVELLEHLEARGYVGAIYANLCARRTQARTDAREAVREAFEGVADPARVRQILDDFDRETTAEQDAPPKPRLQ